MSKVVILLISGEIGNQVLNGMIDMLDCRDLDVVPVVDRLAILISAVLGDTGSGEERAEPAECFGPRGIQRRQRRNVQL